MMFALIWVFPEIVVSQNWWFIMEIPIKMDDLWGNPRFSETSIYCSNFCQNFRSKSSHDLQVFKGLSDDDQAKVPRPMPDDAPVTSALQRFVWVGWKHGETRVHCEETAGKMQLLLSQKLKDLKAILAPKWKDRLPIIRFQVLINEPDGTTWFFQSDDSKSSGGFVFFFREACAWPTF